MVNKSKFIHKGVKSKTQPQNDTNTTTAFMNKGTLFKIARNRTTPQANQNHSDGNTGITTKFVKMEESTKKDSSCSKDIEMGIQKKGVLSEQFVDDDTSYSANSKLKEEIERYRRRAEEGFPFLQALTFFGGIGMIFSCIIGFQEGGVEGFSIVYSLLSFYSWVFGLFIIGLEGRVFLIDISGLHRFVSNYMKLFRFMIGRGLLYMFVGSLHMCLMSKYSLIPGSVMSMIGLITFIIGVFMSARLKTLLKKTKDPSLSENVFNFYDTNHDGYIDIEGFRDLLIGTAIHIKDVDGEFGKIDDSSVGLVSYKQMKEWVEARDYCNKTVLDHLDIIGLFYAD